MSFFDKIGEKASEVYNTTAEKTNKLTREMKLKSAINDNKGRIIKIYQDIGEQIYQRHMKSEEVSAEKEFSEQLYQIDLYQKEIDEAQMEILSLKDLKLCESCSKEMSAKAKFCPFCGTEQKNSKFVKKDVQQKNIEEDVIKKIEENEAFENAILNDNSKRESDIFISKGILDIEEPKIIVEEIENNNIEE